MRLKGTCSLEEKLYDKPRQCIKKQRHHFADRSPYNQSYGFSSSHVGMWELDHKEGWALKNSCFWIVLEKILESPWIARKSVNPNGNQPWIFIERTDTQATIFWPPDGKIWLIGKDPDAGKDWRQEKGVTEDETVGWHHWLNGHEFEQAPEYSDAQGSLACCSPWGYKEPVTTQCLDSDNSNQDSEVLALNTQINERELRIQKYIHVSMVN